MMSEPVCTADVSAVLPCFRCVSTVGRAIESILNQSVRPHEVILVDDCSGDGTLDLLRDYESRYAGWIKVLVADRNRGAASARNLGWEASRSTYLAFLDADDSWHPEKLRTQYGWMDTHPDFAVSGHQCVWLRDAELPALPAEPAVTQLRPRQWLFRNYFSTPAVMLKRNLPFRFQERKRWAEDYYLWQQIALAGYPMAKLETPLAFMYKAPYGAGGLSAQLWEMERAELDNFKGLYSDGYINALMAASASAFSLLKYGRRRFRRLLARSA